MAVGSRKSVEIVTLLYSMSLAMSSFFQNNLLLRKACNSSVPFGACAVGEAHAQHVVSAIHSWKAVIQYFIPVVLISLAGPWSDSHGRRRKPLMFLPMFGQILTDGLCVLNVYFWSWPPEVAALFEAVTPGLFGGRSMFWVGVISYVSDNSPNELRTLKYGIINSVYTISTLFGTGLAGFVNVSLGFYGAFMVPIALNAIALLIAYYFVQDSSKPYDKSVVWLRPKRLFQSYLDVFRRDTRAFTVTLTVLLLSQALLVGRIGGEYAVTYLFIRYKFKWYEVKYSYYAAYKMMMIFFGTLFAVTVMSHRMKMNDAAIGFIACGFDIVAAVCYVLVTEPWQLCVVPAIDFFHGTALSISTSLTSKLVDTDELGRINSVQGIVTTLMSFVVVPLYSATYNFTFEYLAGAVFFLNAILTFPILVMYWIIYCKFKYLWTTETISR